MGNVELSLLPNSALMIFPTLRSSFLWTRRAVFFLQTSLLAPFLLIAADAEAGTEFMRVRPKIVISGAIRMADNYLFSGDFDNAGTASAALHICGVAIESWAKSHGRVPTEQEGFAVLEMKTRVPLDGWDRPILYKNVAAGAKPFLVYSVGPNGRDEGGSGDDILYLR
jgi:hypothetical protein